ncbi:MAG: N-acetyl-alpha-D-glucosaminyl L-malate synthase BshA [Planctomycetes bacterium]|nr:N-acetyl-alpha-D-glucosaminyl L-malate synthase BshA [Planctomycetota bacterium]
MRIALSCHPSQGGSGVVGTELAAGLARRGHEVHLVAYEQPFRYKKDQGVIFHKVNIPDYPLFRHPPVDLSLANKLAQLTREYDLDIIHAHYAVPHAVTALLAKQIVQPHPVRIVTTLHGTDITLVGSHSDFYDLIRHAMNRSDAVTAVSEWLAQETQERFCLDERPEVIPNFIDCARFHPQGRIAFPGKGEEFILVHASNLRPVKRITQTIRVFHRVQKAIPARLFVLGDGPEKGTAAELAAELGISDRVIFDGIRKNMARILRAAHLYFLLSDYESFGLSALEAMACGTPCAASNRGGLPEVINHQDTSLLCPVRAEPATIRLIVNLLSDRDRWAKMSARAAAVACDRFSLNRIVPLYEALYKKAIEKKEKS